MANEISKINMNSEIYNIKDAEARQDTADLKNIVATKVTDVENGTVNNVLNFTNGIKVNGAFIKYDPNSNTVIFE